MKKVKFRWISIVSLLAALTLLLGLFFMLPGNKKALAENTYSPSTIFSAGTGGTVEASEKIGEEDDAKAFVQFTFTDGGKVHFSRDLALKWYTGRNEVNYFSMDFCFPEVKFKEFSITFESEEENVSKEKKTTNSIVFKKSDDFDSDNKLIVWVRDASYEEPEEGEEEEIPDSAKEVFANQDIHIEFDEPNREEPSGRFKLMVGNSEGALSEAGELTNIGGYYLEYHAASSTTPSIPITFKVNLADNAESGTKQLVHMKSMNKQSFTLNESNKVVDDASPVLVLNEKIYAFKLGQKYSLTTKGIDVCKGSISPTREYYMLKKSEGVPVRPNTETLEGDEKEKADPYNYSKLDTSTYFLPSEESEEQLEYVSIRFKLEDGDKANDTYVYLDWYADSSAVETMRCDYYVDEEEIVDGEGDETETKKITKKKSGDDQVEFDFIKVDRDKKGPKYLGLIANDVEKKNTYENEEEFQKAVKAYQADLDKAASYEESKTSAGTGAYIYLPSLRGLIGSDYADYRNLKFSVYYYRPSHSTGSTSASQTSLKYNALKLEVTERGPYKMRVVAQDASNNAMQYYLDGELVTVSSSNVWDIEGIPEFEFYIDYKGPTIEKVKEKSLGYRNDTYTFDEFEIVALAGYKKEYTLYRFDISKLKEGQGSPTYSDFVTNAEKYATENYKDCLVKINTFQNDVSEEDTAKWNRTDNDYYWNPDSSLSFIPQESGFYVLKLTVKDYVLPGKTATAYQVIEIRNPIDTIPAESQWLEENVVSVVLFAISGVLAIAVVVLFLIKPSEKKVEEIDLEKLKGKKKQKTEKKAKKEE